MLGLLLYIPEEASFAIKSTRFRKERKERNGRKETKKEGWSLRKDEKMICDEKNFLLPGPLIRGGGAIRLLLLLLLLSLLLLLLISEIARRR